MNSAYKVLFLATTLSVFSVEGTSASAQSTDDGLNYIKRDNTTEGTNFILLSCPAQKDVMQAREQGALDTAFKYFKTYPTESLDKDKFSGALFFHKVTENEFLCAYKSRSSAEDLTVLVATSSEGFFEDKGDGKGMAPKEGDTPETFDWMGPRSRQSSQYPFSSSYVDETSLEVPAPTTKSAGKR